MSKTTLTKEEKMHQNQMPGTDYSVYFTGIVMYICWHNDIVVMVQFSDSKTITHVGRE